jgi:hypothetical protein
VYYFPPLFLPALLSVPGPTLPWPDGLRASPLWAPALIPVVVPDFILLDFILPDFILESVAPGPTLPSLDAPGAGWVCADAIAVTPNSEATTRVEIASLDCMDESPAFDDDAEVKTCSRDLGSGTGHWFFGTEVRHPTLVRGKLHYFGEHCLDRKAY